MKSYDGVVVKVTDKQVVLLCTQDGTFKNIPRGKNQIPLIGEKLTYKEKKSFFHPMQWVKLASVACLLFLIFSMYPTKPAEAAYIVAIDINPSMEVYLDKDFKVTRVVTLNPEGDRIITKIDYNKKYISEMVKLIIDQCVTEKYLTSSTNERVTTSIIPIKDEYKLNEAVLQSMFQNSLKQDAVTADVNVTLGSKEILEKAHQLKLSVNKYKIYEKLKQKGISVSLETVQSSSITNLLEIEQGKNKKDQKNPSSSNQDKSNQGQNKSEKNNPGQSNANQNNRSQNNKNQNNQGKNNQGQGNSSQTNSSQNNSGHNNQNQNNPGQSKK